MIVFKVNGTKYNFPTRWQDVTYSQYLALLYSSRLTEHISIFTGLDIATLESAEIRGLEKISLALSFLSISPKFERTGMVGPYVLPVDVTVQSTGQFEDLRGLLMKMPKDMGNIENAEKIADLWLEACAIYCQKLRDGKYEYLKVPQMKEELKGYSCAEVLGNGAFFLLRQVNLSPPTMNPFLILSRLLRRSIQGLPGYQRTLDFLLRSSGSAGK